MQTVKALYKLSRPTSTLSGILAVYLGGYVAQTGAWLSIHLAAFITFLLGAAANSWNDYLDIEIDRINQPQRPLPAGMISPKGALIFAAVTGIFAAVISATVTVPVFIIVVTFIILLFIYSLRLKSTVLLGNITVAITSACTPVLGGVAANNVGPSLWLALIIGCGILGREVLKTMADYEGDLRQKCRTIATVWGHKVARRVFYLLALVTLWVMMMPYLLQIYQPIYAKIVAIGVYPVVIYVGVRLLQVHSGRQLERLSQLMKYDFLVWFVAVYLGAVG